MAIGQSQYQDVIDNLSAAGLPTTFTQTGGMNAALEVLLDGGYSLLITDFDDSLAWSRLEHVGWSVGLYPPDQQYDGQVIAFGETQDADVDALRALIDDVLRGAVRPR
ncbi:hypothetical protein [Blastococcus atacamensis]|uniref:hypothetical protein n=1 Tax=Blastococcus atacamensis TaxID=2070508 RepID=UPI0013000B1A|nr:hypothetical protein [Blastococcus atacamensis]